MLIQATQLRPGMIVEYNKDLWRMMTITHITPGNWRGMVQTKLRNVKTGSQTENRFRSEDRVERVILNQSKMQFLYQDGDDFHFMNTENYEQITIPKELIEDVVGFLTPNLEVEVEFYETTPSTSAAENGRAQGGADRSGDEDGGGEQHAEAGDARDRDGNPGAAFRHRGRHDHDQHRDPRVPVTLEVAASRY